MEDKAIQLIAKLPIKAATKALFNETFQLMVSAKDKPQSSIFRHELQGMLNSLEREEVITLSDLENTNKAIGSVWKAKAKAFHLTKRAIEKAQTTIWN